MTTQAAEKTSAFASPWVWGFIGMISVTLAVNVTMAYLAVTTSPGLVVNDYYERGKSFEKRARVQSSAVKQLGWKLSLAAPGELTAGESAVFNLTALGADGQPVTAASARFFAYRPSDAKADFSAPMTRAQDGGYVAQVTFPLKGVWDIIVTLGDGDGRADLPIRVSVAASGKDK